MRYPARRWMTRLLRRSWLIVGDKCTAVSRVLVALDITEDVVKQENPNYLILYMDMDGRPTMEHHPVAHINPDMGHRAGAVSGSGRGPC